MDLGRTIPTRRWIAHTLHAARGAVLGRFEGEDRLWRGMKESYAYVVRGRGSSEYLYRGRVYELVPGAIQLKQPGEIYRDLRRDEPASFDVVLFDRAAIEGARGGKGEIVFQAPAIAAGDPRAAPLFALHALLDRAEEPIAIEAAVAEAALALVRLGGARGEVGHERRAVKRARAYLLEHRAEAVRLDDVADHAGLDKYHLIRAFRAEVGVPPYEFLTHARVHRACELLRLGVSAASAATAVGYCDQSQLHRHFVRLIGITPGRYAARAR